jgi:hypothetical protein
MRIFLLLACLLAGCFGRDSLITRACFDAVALGATVEELECIAGEPYAVHQLCDGGIEYEYVERVSSGIGVTSELIGETHYFFRVVNGHVVSKNVKIERRPAYDLIYQADPNYPMFPSQAGNY